MMFVTVVRRVPQPIIGMVGTRYDRAFAAFEADLDWLETTGVAVERIDPTVPEQISSWPAVQQLLAAEGDRCLPLVLIDDRIVSRSRYLSRAELARAVGHGHSGRSAA